LRDAGLLDAKTSARKVGRRTAEQASDQGPSHNQGTETPNGAPHDAPVRESSPGGSTGTPSPVHPCWTATFPQGVCLATHGSEAAVFCGGMTDSKCPGSDRGMCAFGVEAGAQEVKCLDRVGGVGVPVLFDDVPTLADAEWRGAHADAPREVESSSDLAHGGVHEFEVVGLSEP